MNTFAFDVIWILQTQDIELQLLKKVLFCNARFIIYFSLVFDAKINVIVDLESSVLTSFVVLSLLILHKNIFGTKYL